jgi:hypothetical protein
MNARFGDLKRGWEFRPCDTHAQFIDLDTTSGRMEMWRGSIVGNLDLVCLNAILQYH